MSRFARPNAPAPPRRHPTATARPLRAAAPLLVVLALAAAGVGWWARARAARREGGLSVLLITVDTLRADAVGAYGNTAGATPWIDRLAGAGVRFADAHAHNVVTLPSHANILSGRHPLEHGVRDNAGYRFPAELETLAGVLAARGYRTGAFVSAFPLAARFGLARGFAVYDDRFLDAHGRPAFLMQERPASQTVARARRFVDESGTRPYFCWVHVFEPHFPYAPPAPWAERFRDAPYLGEVAAADAALAPLLEPLLASGPRGRTLVVLTADHGESLGEHGEATHGIFAYEATLRVPLILFQPRLLRPRVVRQPARHVDLLPTVLDALDLPPPAALPGRSLLELATGGAGEAGGAVTTYFEALSGWLNRGWAPIYGVLRDGHKYIDLPLPELYDLERDPRELSDAAARQPARVTALRGLLAPLRAADVARARASESAETRARLSGLGYLSTGGGPGARVPTPEDDPKRLIALDGVLQEVVGLYLAGDLRAALARCRELVRLRPGMTAALLHLAHLERESGQLDAAVRTLERALAQSPDDATVPALLGAYLIQAGRAREAVARLEPLARGVPADTEVLRAYALGLARLGRAPEALAALERARAADPASAALRVDEATVHLTAHDTARARTAFEAALALNPDTPRAHSSLGVMAAEDGALAAALEHFRRAAALDARECDKPLAAGWLLAQRGRTADARACLEFFVACAPPELFADELARARQWLGASGAAARVQSGPGAARP